MSRVRRAALLALLLALPSCTTDLRQSRPVYTQYEFAYPQAERVAHYDDYHGTRVADPYRWLEDPDSPETRAWIEQENEVTYPYLHAIPARDAILKRLTQLWNYEKYGIPFKEGGRYFFTKNDGLQNQSVLYTMKSLDDEPRLLLDPNTLSEDGTVALAGYSISEDGTQMAYGLATAGSDWNEWYVRDIETGQDLDDHLKWIKFSSAAWTHDGRGFFYGRYDEPNESTKYEDLNYFQKVFYHQVGTPQTEDTLVYDRPDQKEWGFGNTISEDGRYLILTVWQGTDDRNGLFYKDLMNPSTSAGHDRGVVELFPVLEAEYAYIGNDGTRFWIRTNADAPLGRVIAVDLHNPQRNEWTEVVRQSEDTLRGVSMVNKQLICSYLRDATTAVRIFDLEGEPVRDVHFPGIGTASGFGGERDDTETFYSYSSFALPDTVYRYDLNTGTSTVFRKPDVDVSPDDYVTKQVFYHSKDGTLIPLFITYKNGLRLDGSNPTYLYGYGGFNIPLRPGYSVTNQVWMDMGGIYAMACLRGGGEYGEPWHMAGTKSQKQNVFDDFISAAEYLIDEDYTSPEKLAIAGGSNGGLLVGACMVQRPDLFGACLPAVGVMDMLRFQKFTIGWAWVADYGSSDVFEEFGALYAYSPYHNLQPGTAYPPTLVTTADHDDRVVPAHSFKFAAALQHAHSGEAPVLIRIETKAGHGAGKPTSKRIEEAADKLAFLTDVLEMNPEL